MDINTILKTMNGMAEKIEVLEDKLKNRCDYIDKHNRVHFDAMAEKIETLESRIINLEDFDKTNITKCFNKFDKIDDRLDALEDNIHDLSLATIRTNKRCDDLAKVDNNIIECMDDLEAKNYQIKSDLDELINKGVNNG